ncbi:MAG: site-2 protease family protein [Eubacteriales bacterium]|nr:site-2 protease family protein [Clostridiales bacterium]MDD7773458.1 site-2 protease family protein [Eubacteriales bacterium]MDY3942029.1 site-2 protease family protein [Eubacteriales bacterium]
MLANILGSLTELLYSIPCILIALTVHEVAHGWMAYKLGDPTAKTMGRLTLNPLKHLDPIGALCMLFFHFGWAKPVPIDSRYFKKPKRDVALTALAGPVSNILMAFCGILLFSILRAVFVQVGAASSFGATIQQLVLYLLFYFYSLNLSLAVFNFLPVPPLDGSRIFLVFLPQKYYFGIMKYERYIQLALMLCLWLGFLDGILSTLVGWLASGMFALVGLIPGL